MGFIEDTGVAQFYRDSRIAPIYEGTNGIQAIDLVTRKLTISDGLAVNNFLKEIKETSKKCLEKKDSDFQIISNDLNKAITRLETCTKTLLKWTKCNQKRSILFSASDYLELFGIIAGSHYLAKGALFENDKNEKSTEARKKLALFFTSQILIESELFGHEKGAFTGADQMRQGRFEQANGGTLFLDEIGDMPAATQTRLLRVLSDGEFYRVGGHKPLRADVRIIAATHQNLEDLVKHNKFREDLFHRLNVIRIHIPTLAQRRDDIPLLILSLIHI